MKQIIFRGGYEIKPQQMDVCPCIIAGYYKQTANYGLPYVMVIEDDQDKECNETRIHRND